MHRGPSLAILALAVLLVVLPAASAQPSYPSALTVLLEDVKTDPPFGGGRLLPGESGVARLTYQVSVPPGAFCVGPIEMTYKARMKDGQKEFAAVQVEPAQEVRSWGEPVRDLGAAPAGATVYGFETRATLTMADHVPAFVDVFVEVWATARPLSQAPGCTVSESTPMVQDVSFKADYVARIAATSPADPYLPHGILLTVTNEGNGPTVIDILWMTESSAPRMSSKRPLLESTATSGTKAVTAQDVVLNWGESPEDWDGTIRLTGTFTPEGAAPDIQVSERRLTFDKNARPAEAEYVAGPARYEYSDDEAADLPSAGLFGAFAALGLVAFVRRRNA